MRRCRSGGRGMGKDDSLPRSWVEGPAPACALHLFLVPAQEHALHGMHWSKNKPWVHLMNQGIIPLAALQPGLHTLMLQQTWCCLPAANALNTRLVPFAYGVCLTQLYQQAAGVIMFLDDSPQCITTALHSSAQVQHHTICIKCWLHMCCKYTITCHCRCRQTAEAMTFVAHNCCHAV